MTSAFAERKAIWSARPSHVTSQATISDRIRKLLQESDGFTISIKTILGDCYCNMPVVSVEARFIQMDWEGSPLLVNVDHIVELSIHE